MKDYHYILGVKKGASKAEIKQAFRKLSKKFHPDVNNGDKYFEERFKDIREAYEALIDNTYSTQAENTILSPLIIEFSISKNDLQIDENVTLRWKVINANKININLFGEVASSGEKNIKFKNLISSKEIKLTASNESKQVTKSLFLTVKKAFERKVKNKSTSKSYAPILLITVIVLISSIIYFSSSQNEKNGYSQSQYSKPNYSYQQNKSNYSNSKSSYNYKPNKSDYSNSKSNSYSTQSNTLKNDETANLFRNEKIESHQITTSSGSFNIGSRRSEVIEVMGTPTSVRKIGPYETLNFGSSTVSIENGKVTQYSNYDNNLRIK